MGEHRGRGGGGERGHVAAELLERLLQIELVLGLGLGEKG